MAGDRSTERVPLRSLVRHRAFLALYIAETQSIVGDQLARLALSVLVFDRTGSTLAAALTYAVTFLPAVLGGLALGRLGDRYQRRRVMVGTDIARALLFIVMAIPGLPLWAVIAVLAVAVFLGPAFTSAEVGYLAAALDQETFRAATAVRLASNQLAQVAGFAIGGVLVAVVRPRGALLLDAATFAVSALVITVGLRATASRLTVNRAVPVDGRSPSGDLEQPEPPTGAPFAGLWRTEVTRTFLALTVLMGLFIVPEALAVPFGRAIDVSTAQTGLLIAMIPLGSALGALVVTRVPSAYRRGVAGGMAIACGLPLLVSATHPAWSIACATWFVSGFFAAYQVEAITVLVQSIPDDVRSHLIGILGALLIGAQGIGFLIGGAIAQVAGAATAITVCAGLGSGLALLVVLGALRRIGRRPAGS